jgi:hypothetical protein
VTHKSWKGKDGLILMRWFWSDGPLIPASAKAVLSRTARPGAQVDSARRAVGLEIQIKLLILSPTNGVVLPAPPSRAIHARRHSLVGGDDKTITVYIPDDRHGLLSIGQR